LSWPANRKRWQAILPTTGANQLLHVGMQLTRCLITDVLALSDMQADSIEGNMTALVKQRSQRLYAREFSCTTPLRRSWND
jgi:hypothetical protein